MNKSRGNYVMVQRNQLQALISCNTGGMSSFTNETVSDLPGTSAKLPFAHCMIEILLTWAKPLIHAVQYTFLVGVCYNFLLFSIVLKNLIFSYLTRSTLISVCIFMSIITWFYPVLCDGWPLGTARDRLTALTWWEASCTKLYGAVSCQ